MPVGNTRLDGETQISGGVPSSSSCVKFLSSALINCKNNCENCAVMFFVSPKCTLPTAGAFNTVCLPASHILAYLVAYSVMKLWAAQRLWAAWGRRVSDMQAMESKKWSCWIRFGDLRLRSTCVTPRRLGKVVFWPTVLAGTRGVELNMHGLGQRLTHLVGITLQSRDHCSNDGTVWSQATCFTTPIGQFH